MASGNTILFANFKKAFDTVPHRKLLKTLEEIGIRGNFLFLIENYLKNRQFHVEIQNKKSENKSLLHGHPQRSKLGPLLFIIYINNLIKQLPSQNVFASTDDTAIVCAHENLNEAIRSLQENLDFLSKWCHDNGIILNASKT